MDCKIRAFRGKKRTIREQLTDGFNECQQVIIADIFLFRHIVNDQQIILISISSKFSTMSGK